MAKSSPDDPFAEFAVPKVSAVEHYKSRREQDRRARREYWLFLVVLAAVVATAASGGASISADIQVLPAALGLAVLGTLLGLLVGWLVGAAAWAFVSFQRGPLNPVAAAGAELVRGNSWDKMSVWLSVWGAIGIAGGGAWGASKGAELAATAAPGSLLLWTWFGALAGLPIGFVVWLVLRRAIRRNRV